MIEPEANRPFSLTRGGWFRELLQRVHLLDARGRVRWIRIVAILWIPMVVAATIRWLLGAALEPVMFDASVHVRELVTVPLLFLAEHLLEQRCAESAQLVRQERLAERTSVDSILARAEHLASSRVVEAVLAITAVIGGQAALWGLIAPGGFIHAAEESVGSFATFWYATIGVPLLQFLTMRFLWRWLIWSYVLVRLSRLPLAMNALHPDRAAGLRFLANPIDAFAVFMSANLCIASAAWTTKVEAGHGSVESFAPIFLAFVILAVLISCGPLLFFSPKIYQARHHDVERYHALAYEYVRDFRRKWITSRSEALPRSQHTLLGTGDIQSLNDLGGSFATADGTRSIVFGGRALLMICVGALVPMIPLLLVTVPVPEILQRVGKLLPLPLV